MNTIVYQSYHSPFYSVNRDFKQIEYKEIVTLYLYRYPNFKIKTSVLMFTLPLSSWTTRIRRVVYVGYRVLVISTDERQIV